MGREIRVQGVARGIPARHHVWIAHQDRRGLFWPKDFEVVPDSVGRFERIVYEGGTLNEFTLQLLLTSRTGHEQMANWVAECSRSGIYPGIQPAPTLFHVLDSITLKLDPWAGTGRLITVKRFIRPGGGDRGASSASTGDM